MVRVYNPGPDRTRPWNGDEVVVPTGISEQPDEVGSVIVREFTPLGVAQLGLHVETDDAGAPLPIADQVVIANADAFFRNRYGVDQTPGELARAAAAPAPAPEPVAAEAPASQPAEETKAPADEQPSSEPAATAAATSENPASEPAKAPEAPETPAS